VHLVSGLEDTMPKAYMMVHLELTDPEAFVAGFGSKVEILANES